MTTNNSRAINQRRAERSVSDRRDEFITKLPPQTRSSVYEFLDESRGDGYHADRCFKNAAEPTALCLARAIVYEVRNKSSARSCQFMLKIGFRVSTAAYWQRRG